MGGWVLGKMGGKRWEIWGRGGGETATTMGQQPAKVSQAKPNNARLNALGKTIIT